MSDVSGEIEEIREDLRLIRFWLPEELREDVSDWIEESHNKSDADTARGYVETKLNEKLAKNPMYATAGLSRGEDGFPERCRELECPHVGGACPVLMDDTEKRWRERKLDEAETEAEARQVYQQQAIDVECTLIPELLEEWDSQHAEFIQRGSRLLSRAEDEIAEEDQLDADASDLDEYDQAVPDGGETDA